jgi:histidyl-tRNA synthetase
MMASIQSVRGTRDFYPEAMAFRNWLYSKIREVSEGYGYQEYEAPFIEKLELYAAKSGDELIKEQSYVFPDRGGEMIVLRPELTPSLARMIAAAGRNLVRPIRWWSFGPFWRYEKPQRGRSREFFQWNIDLLGVDTPQADAEIVSIIASFLKAIGLTSSQVAIKFNHRRLMEKQLNTIGIPASKIQEVFRLIDRRDKMKAGAWGDFARSIISSEEQINSLLKILEDEEGWKNEQELVEFYQASDSLGILDYIRYDPSVIRGLDYYTGTVFEAFDLQGSERSILGGGRYDNLVGDVGGEPISAVGFAMGDVVIRLVLEKYGLIPVLNPNPVDLLITTFDVDLQGASLALASELRDLNYKVEWYPQASRLNKQLKYADTQKIPFVAILGPEEVESSSVTIKDLSTGTQETVSREGLSGYLKGLLERQNTS